MSRFPIPLFCIYDGPSMYPLLRGQDLLEVVPYDGRPVRRGDVVLIRDPDRERLIIHRVASTAGDGIRTRGDNNARDDDWILGETDIIGRVVAAYRNRECHRIAAGMTGRWEARWFRGCGALAGSALILARPVYRFLNRPGIGRFLRRRIRPRVVVYGCEGRRDSRLQLGRRVIGYYDKAARRWRLLHPYRLLVDVSELPVVRETAERRRSG